MINAVATRAPGIVARAFNKVIFEVRDAEARMTAQSFDFWSATTRNFMAGKKSFPFDLATPSRLRAVLYAGTTGAKKHTGKLRQIFWQQEFGFVLDPSERERLVLGGSPPQYAVPTKNPGAHLRTARATVRPSQTPGALLKTRGGGFAKFKKRRRRLKGVGNLGTHVFVSPKGKAILEKTPGGGVRFLYGLYDRKIHVDEHLHFLDTASKVIGKTLIPKLLSEWDRSLGRF